MRLIIAGGRDFTNLALMTKAVDTFIADTMERIVIISGTARGADQTGEQYAASNHYFVERYPAQWDKFGKSAGYKRNEQMANQATHCIVFWDGQSRGSKHMIDLAAKYNLTTQIIYY